MAKDQTFLNPVEITSIANSLKEKTDRINNEYKNNCVPVMELSKECIELSGLDTTEYFRMLDEIYNKINERLLRFSEFLINDIVAEYTTLSERVVKNTDKNIQ
jgi:hypothetical protein